MKKIIYYSFFCFFISTNIYSQIEQGNHYNLGAKKPFIGHFTNKRMTADKIEIKKHNNITIESEYVVKKNTDGLTDVIINGSSYTTISYNIDGKMKSFKTAASYNPNEVYEYENYTYDEHGNISEITGVRNAKYYYNKSNKDSVVWQIYSEVQNKWIPSYKTIITYTSDGYINDDYQYITEESKYTDKPYSYKYTFDSNDRLISVVNCDTEEINSKYEYYENGYAQITYAYGELYGKWDSYFDEKGELTKYIAYNWDPYNSRWYLVWVQEYTYYYDTTGNMSVTNKVKITSSKGCLIIDSDISTIVTVYSLSGSVVAQRKTSGFTEIPLQSGVYIVTANNESYKIIINN